MGYYLNPDEIEKEVNDRGYFDVRGLGLQISQEEIVTFFENHPLTKRTERGDFIDSISYIEKGFISFANVGFDSYMSAILTDFFTTQIFRNRQIFHFRNSDVITR